MAKKVGELTLELDFAVGKLKGLVSSRNRNKLIDTKCALSLNKQLKILNVSKGLHYYKPIKAFSSDYDIKILNIIDLIYTKHPYYETTAQPNLTLPPTSKTIFFKIF